MGDQSTPLGDQPDARSPRAQSGAGVALRRAAPWMRRTVAIVGVVLLVTLNLRLYTPVRGPATADELRSHLSYLRGQLDDGLGDDMQRRFPEGFFFSHVLYGLTWIEVGLRAGDDDPVRGEALAEARWAMDQLVSEAGRGPFSPNLTPAFGGFYVGWTNYLRAGVVALQNSPTEGDFRRLQEGCDTLVAALAQTDGPFLASYPGQTWPVDTFPAVVSIEVCGRLLDPAFHSVVDQWLIELDGAVDPATGLVAHQTAPTAVGPRATSQTMILRFLAELDPERSSMAYARFREDFVVSRFGLPAVVEYPAGVDGPADVDSGPLIGGVSLSASVVMVGAAQVNGDQELARALRQEGQAFGFPLPFPGGRRYAFGQMPLGDLFVVWASAAHPWLEEAATQPAAGVGFAWRWPTHLVSLLIGVGLPMLVWPGARRRSRGLGQWAALQLAERKSSVPESMPPVDSDWEDER